MVLLILWIERNGAKPDGVEIRRMKGSSRQNKDSRIAFAEKDEQVKRTDFLIE
jgi:hypothetical protein